MFGTGNTSLKENKRVSASRDKKRNKTSILNNKNELSRSSQDKIEFKKQSIHQKKQLTRKIKQLTEDEQTRTRIILRVSFVILLITLLVSII